MLRYTIKLHNDKLWYNIGLKYTKEHNNDKLCCNIGLNYKNKNEHKGNDY